ncbi:MAG TPA: GldG family protein [Bryobacteraceae bacterium]|jgi:ABC-type uncharacterized transport system involved in gliding motility auxiliary subunit|nr:GldG family protein [Bryobacteraceae bacterium]
MARSGRGTVSGKQAQYGATALLYSLVVIAALVLVNWLANRYNKSADLTANKQYTLSDQTKKIVKNLKGDATITYFDTRRGFESAKPMLDRYANLSNKIHVQYVDYLRNPAEAAAYGVRTAGSAFVQVGSRREEAKALTEEGLTGAFVKDLKGVRTVCVVSGSKEHALDDTTPVGLSQFKDLLARDNYQAQSISLVDKTAVPGECTVLVIAGPKFDYTPNEVSAIKTYVEGGGRAMFLLDPPLNFGHDQIASNDALVNLLASWGVTPEKDLVLEQNPVGQMLGLGAETPLVKNYASHPIVNDLNSITGFPLARSLEIKNGDKTTVEKLFSTSDGAFAVTKLSSNEINPQDPSNKKGPFLLGAAGSYNTGKPSNPGRFAVIGSSGFMDNRMLRFQANSDLALNAINWLSSDEDLISIRPKTDENQRFDITQHRMNIFSYVDLIGMPLFVIVLGIGIYLKRR